eukprot:391239_1
MLNEMELADGDGNEDGGSPHDEEGGMEEISADEYQETTRAGPSFGETMRNLSTSAAWNDVTRLGADINRRIETHTGGVADKVTHWMKGLVMTADEPDAVHMRHRAHDAAIITQDYGEPAIHVISDASVDTGHAETLSETYSNGEAVTVTHRFSQPWLIFVDSNFVFHFSQIFKFY